MRAAGEPDRRKLIAAVLGERPADLSIENVCLVNVITGEIYPASVDIAEGIIILVRTEGEPGPEAKERFDGGGNYLIPGYIDTHVHVESTMMTPENFARAVIPWGTTTVVADPHEIANVMGVAGVQFMLESGRRSPLRHFVLAPPCVPSVPGLEESGAVFTEKEIGRLLDEPGVIGIGELMNYLKISQGDERMNRIIAEGISRDKFLQGHAPRLQGRRLAAYRLAGPQSDHECRSSGEAAEKARLGLHINLKTSSLSNHLPEALMGIQGQRWRDNVSLCTDDVHAGVICREGHLNRVVAKAVGYGADPLEAVRFATYNGAREYGFEDLGAIAPGFAADLQLVEGLNGCRPLAVWIGGKLAAREGEMVMDWESGPAEPFCPPKLAYIRSEEDLELTAPAEGGETLVIQSRADGPFNRAAYERLPVRGGKVVIEEDPDLAWICVCNRYGKEQKTIAPIRGFGSVSGAFGATVAHDSHNLVLIYRDPADALLAVKKIQEMGGGMALAEHGRICASLPLPAGGLMSFCRCEEVAAQAERLEQALKEKWGNVWLLKHATAALPVLPGVLITDLGIVDGDRQEFLPQFRIPG